MGTIVTAYNEAGLEPALGVITVEARESPLCVHYRTPYYRATVSEFPQCASLAITTRVQLAAALRRRGFGHKMRAVRLAALKAAGFRSELVTVRDDNPAEIRVLLRSGAVRVGEHPSDYGGTVGTWMTPLVEAAYARTAGVGDASLSTGLESRMALLEDAVAGILERGGRP